MTITMDRETREQSIQGEIPLPKEITDDIRAILEGIERGELSHIQRKFHYRQSHCVGGWKELRDIRNLTAEGPGFIGPDGSCSDVEWKKALRPYLLELVEKTGDGHWTLDDGDDREYSYGYPEWAWALTNSEAYVLMNGEAELDEQFALLHYLENGHRLDPGLGFSTSMDRLHEWFDGPHIKAGEQIEAGVSYETKDQYPSDYGG